MQWALFALLTGFIYSISSVLDKLVLSKWVKDPFLPSVIVAFSGMLSGFIILSLRGYPDVPVLIIALTLVAGSLNFLTILFYLEAVKVEEVSRVVPLFRMSPIFIAIMAVLFLDAVLEWSQYLGMILLVGGAILISTRKGQHFAHNKGLRFMLLATICTGGNATLIKYSLGFMDFWEAYSISRIGGCLSVVPFLWLLKDRLLEAGKNAGISVIALIVFTSILVLCANFSLTVARSLGDITLVSALTSTQSFFVLLITSVLSKWYPLLMKEDLLKGTIARKIIAILLMTVGAVLVTSIQETLAF